MDQPHSDDMRSLIGKLDLMYPSQLMRLDMLVDSFLQGTEYWINPGSDFATDEFAHEFGDLLLLHHNASLIPLTKDKFEYALVDTMNTIGHTATKLPNGNPGEDVIVDGSPWSLKTQADRSIKVDTIHISKFMELGKGAWHTEEDIGALRERMFAHMTHYDRIFTLRCLSARTGSSSGHFSYELVEIPKALLLAAEGKPIQIKMESGQNPKPASCFVYDDQGLAFELYFDGGTERKLQVRNLAKRNCRVHATWEVKATP